MELKFEKNPCRHLHLAAWEVKRQEQTQEVKLPEELPDVGRVLGCWGQPVLRSKEWRGGGMTAAGGCMTWTLYVPEDGSEPRCIQSWIPFQLKWEFPQTDREGTMNITLRMRSADARTVSARRLMVRVSVIGIGIAADHAETAIYEAGEVPEDVKLLRRTYPVTLPVEAGEKILQLDEELALPAGFTGSEKLIRYELRPQVREQKMIGDRMVYRGSAGLRLLMMSDGGRLSSGEVEIPFSQYVDLDNDHEDASAQIDLVLTGLEAEQTEDGKLRLKAGFAAQYIIWQRKMLELVEDAYSLRRDVKLFEEMVTLPMLLEERAESVSSEQTVNVDFSQLADGTYLPDHPELTREGQQVIMGLPGNAQILYYDAQGNLQGTTVQCEGRFAMNADEDTVAQVDAHSMGNPQVIPAGDGVTVNCEGQLHIRTISGQGLPMITALELGELKEPDPMRPSLILRRAGEQSLWELAKCSGSTVDAIRMANGLEADPEKGRMLLIPVQ